eukprot:TCONS_00001279-protein
MLQQTFLVLFVLFFKDTSTKPLAVCHTKCRMIFEHCNFSSTEVRSFRTCHVNKEECIQACSYTYTKKERSKCRKKIDHCFAKYHSFPKLSNCVRTASFSCRMFVLRKKKKPNDG